MPDRPAHWLLVTTHYRDAVRYAAEHELQPRQWSWIAGIEDVQGRKPPWHVYTYSHGRGLSKRQCEALSLIAHRERMYL